MDGHSKNCIFRTNKPETKCFEFPSKRWNIQVGLGPSTKTRTPKLLVTSPPKLKCGISALKLQIPFQIPTNWSRDLRFIDETNFESLQPTLRQNKT